MVISERLQEVLARYLSEIFTSDIHRKLVYMEATSKLLGTLPPFL
jgi:hypothetical protein